MEKAPKTAGFSPAFSIHFSDIRKGRDSLFIAYLRTILLYLILIAVIRIMGKRQIGQMEASEFVVTMLIADLASVPMQDTGIPLLSGLIPILTVLAIELLLAFASMHSIGLRKLLCGKPLIVMQDGKINQQNLRRAKLTADELTQLLRETGTTDLSTVKYAILETNGRLSKLLYPKYEPACAKDAGIRTGELQLPVTVISDGRVLDENLHKAGRDTAWLTKQLHTLRLRAADIFLMTVEPSGRLYLSVQEERT